MTTPALPAICKRCDHWKRLDNFTGWCRHLKIRVGGCETCGDCTYKPQEKPKEAQP